MPRPATSRTVRGLLAVFALAIPAPSALAAVIQVPADKATIQGAVNAAAASGDRIEVSPGVYDEQVSILGKQLELVGLGSLPGDVVIGGATGGIVVQIASGSDVELRNLRVTGGTVHGVRVAQAEATLVDVAVVENTATVGPGVYAVDSDVELSRCFIAGNEAAGGGGALYAQNSTVSIDTTLVWLNTFSRGAIFANASSVTIDRTHFFGNEGNPSDGASAIEATLSSFVTMTNSVINGNTGAFPLAVVHGAVAKVFNVTVAENDSAVAGLGRVDGDLILQNSIARDPSLAPIIGSGSADAGWSNVSGGLPGPGMIDADPMFKPSAFFQLDAGSPCVDAADGSAIPATPDFLGGTRFVDDQNVADDGTGAIPYLDMGAIERVPAIRYVKEDAAGTGDGSSWGDAMNDLQDALDAASAGDVEEIWVAAGVYQPDRGTGDRSDAFVLRDGVAVLGGFAGTEEQRDSRDADVNQATLSGAIGAAGIDDNSHHVVVATALGSNTVLDGFIVQKGAATGSGTSSGGGGILVTGGAPRFRDLIVRQCEASGSGVAIHSVDSDATFDRLRVNRNGWLRDAGSTMLFDGGTPTLTNLRLNGNVSAVGGSAIYFQDTVGALMTNATVWGNRTGSWCGGVFVLFGAEAEVRNSIVWGNLADNPISGQPTIQFNINSVSAVTSSTIEGWIWEAQDSNGYDPGFVDAAGPDGVAGTADDDLRLAAGSAMIDAGVNAYLPAEFDRDVDALERFRDDAGVPDTGSGPGPVVDRGAHEFAGTSCGGDVDGNGTVGFDDLLQILADWGVCGGCPSDLDRNGTVDFNDLLTLLAAWGPCP